MASKRHCYECIRYVDAPDPRYVGKCHIRNKGYFKLKWNEACDIFISRKQESPDGK